MSELLPALVDRPAEGSDKRADMRPAEQRTREESGNKLSNFMVELPWKVDGFGESASICCPWLLASDDN